MEKTATKNKIRYVQHRIPDTLVYELMDGKPVYYKGYEEVVNLQKEKEAIMGSSALQSDIIDVILHILYAKVNRKKYKIRSNEIGLHLNHRNNLAADISIFDRDKIYESKQIEDKYEKIAPKIIIEIDTKADLSNFDDVMDYYTKKTKKLFQFGVEKVFWILTKNKQIIEAVPNDKWLIKNWNNEIELFDNLKFTLDNLLKDDGIYDFVYTTENKEEKE